MKPKISLRFHMPTIFDSGWARKLIQAVKKHGEVDAVVTGTMGPTAMLDNFLEDEVKLIRKGWSSWIESSAQEYDFLINATYTTDLERSLADCWHLNKRIEKDIPLIGIDTNSKTIVPWDARARDFTETLAEEIGLQLGNAVDFGKTFWEEEGRKYRKILAPGIGDHLLINGTVVGRVKSKNVIVIEEDEKVIDIQGVKVKKYGLDKVKDISLEEAKIDTASLLRKPYPNRRNLKLKKKNKVAFIDHAGYHIYNFIDESIGGAVTVGDDTTAIAGDILSRYSTPIAGLVDGDADELLVGPNYAEGSIILYLTEDDSFGRTVFKEIFNEKSCVDAKMGELKNSVIDLGKENEVLKRIQNF